MNKKGRHRNSFQDATKETKKINPGRLRAIVYDTRARML